MPLDAALLDILVCPVDRGTLLLVGSDTDGILYNPLAQGLSDRELDPGIAAGRGP